MKATEKDFLDLMQKHKGILYKISRMYFDYAEDQEDLIQEMTYQLWKSYQNFKGDSQFSTWMYRVCLNTALTFFKKEDKKQDKYELHDNYDKADDESNAYKEEQLSYFYAAVQELNKVEKALIFLFLEGMNHKEIAENLGISEVNARVKLNRTKEKLQTIIKKNGYEF
ncbi:sigma-70 family RNA polymerase sigma factor [Flavobacterium sp. xlx-214]|uniref:RNA polymerase sigma factor n=1 Tax=unclassified Flavobacterium TaxID=196869 RepID=UPI0013D55137|nr:MULTISPECIES: sigma-70 family RNA polymerase sigma factor [unclassified Flavobacterium]MBA5793343.1 sigma-70 family RNA polymerase sigma factor [Flavobacterium sp. xlx-221]QMI84094.1 sigma-70 family RNA polymerase sigma factor [Flavobacterium sp. xlx-214]